jgi:hypothetical protein
LSTKLHPSGGSTITQLPANVPEDASCMTVEDYLSKIEKEEVVKVLEATCQNRTSEKKLRKKALGLIQPKLQRFWGSSSLFVSLINTSSTETADPAIFCQTAQTDG